MKNTKNMKNMKNMKNNKKKTIKKNKIGGRDSGSTLTASTNTIVQLLPSPQLKESKVNSSNQQNYDKILTILHKSINNSIDEDEDEDEDETLLSESLKMINSSEKIQRIQRSQENEFKLEKELQK